ncbi:MAG: hypothetical protein XE04_0323 [Marinimicrobia bacterium 46_43]|nr:MAG: hypothetical protein XE04_0323 [Marinimicrobia bacterium 46_43]
MNLPGFLDTLPVNPFVKGILTVLISCICMSLLFFLIVYYRRISRMLINRKRTDLIFQLKPLFTGSLYNDTSKQIDIFYKLQLPVSLLFFVYLFPVSVFIDFCFQGFTGDCAVYNFVGYTSYIFTGYVSVTSTLV